MATKTKPRSPKEKIEWISLKKLSLLREFQMRLYGLDEQHVRDLVEAIRDSDRKDDIPPVIVYRLKDGRLIVVDGFHRCEAYLRLQMWVIPCVVVAGTWFEAFCAASAANKEHNALKRSNKDKRRAVECFVAALKGEGQAWTNRRIAQHVGVSSRMVDLYMQAEGGAQNAHPLLASDGRYVQPQGGAQNAHPPTPKFALPSGIRDLALGKDLPCPDPIRKRLTEAGVSTAGDFYARFKAKDLCGLEAKEADQVRFELQSRYIATTTAAAEHADPRRLFAAVFKRLTAGFTAEHIDRAQAWWIQNKRPSGTRPFFLEGIAPTGEEAAAFIAVLIASEEFVRGPKEGASLLDGLSEPKPLKDMVGEAIIDLGKGAKPAAIQEHIRAKHGDHYAEASIAECMSSLGKTPPTLKNGPVACPPRVTDETKRKAVDAFAEKVIDSLERRRLDQKLVNVRNFPPQVAGALSRQGISTVRELLKDAQDLGTAVSRAVNSVDYTDQAARCIKVIREYLDVRPKKKGAA